MSPLVVCVLGLLSTIPSVFTQGVRYPTGNWNNQFKEIWQSGTSNNGGRLGDDLKRFTQNSIPNNFQNGFQNQYRYNFSSGFNSPGDSSSLEDIIRQQFGQEGINLESLETIPGNTVQFGNIGGGNFGGGGGNFGGGTGNNGFTFSTIGGNQNPNFQFLNPAGVRIALPGPYDESDQYRLTYHVNVNQELGNSPRGQYNGEVVIPRGSPWTFTVPDLRVKYFDTIYYRAEVAGQQGRRTWKRDYKGFYQVPSQNPHGAGSPVIEDRLQTSRPNTQQAQFPSLRPTAPPINSLPGSWVDSAQPSFLYLDQSGVRVNLPGPYEDSNVYLLKYRVDVNKDVNGVNDGTYKGEVTIPKGNDWSFTVPNLRVKTNDRVHYWVEVSGRDGSRIWSRIFRGYNYVNDVDPHGPENAQPQTTPPPVYSRPSTYPTRPPTMATRPPTIATRPTTRPTQAPTTPMTTRTTQPTWTTQITTRKPQQCQMSSTTYNKGKRPCVGVQIVDQLEFNSIEQIGGTEPEESFTVFSKDSVVRRDGLKYPSIVPSLLEEKYGNYFVDQQLTLQRCTSQNSALCSKQAAGYNILPPVLSGRQTTENSFSFCYGQLEITAKLPTGDWVVPELWLMPKNRQYGDKSGKIVLGMSRGNRQLFDGVQDHGGRVLEVGVHIGNNKQTFQTPQDRMWAEDYHTFQLNWSPDGMVFSVDNKEVGRISPGSNGLDPSMKGRNKMAPFDQEFYLVYGVHVGGDKDFPDTLIGKPWLNQDPKDKLNFWRNRTSWHSTWNTNTELNIYDIKLNSLNY